MSAAPVMLIRDLRVIAGLDPAVGGCKWARPSALYAMAVWTQGLKGAAL